MSDLSPTKIAFPPPPPTSNTLTAAQRNHLLKSTKKLGQVLGATPQVLDETYPLGFCSTTGPLLVQLHFGTLRAHSTNIQHSRRGSLDSISSNCSSYESTCSGTPIISGRISPSSNYPDTHGDSWRLNNAKKRPSLLKLSRNDSLKASSVLLEPITPTAPSPPVSSTDNIRYTLMLPTRDSLYSEAPTFLIPSETTMRREKMERVKRKLGEGVPIDLVFPSQLESDPNFQYPPKPQTAATIMPISPSGHQPQSHPRLTVQYSSGAGKTHHESITITERNNLGPIMENIDEQRTSSPCSYIHASGMPKHRISNEEEVDIDLDMIFRRFAEHLGLRRRVKNIAVSEFEMVTV